MVLTSQWYRFGLESLSDLQCWSDPRTVNIVNCSEIRFLQSLEAYFDICIIDIDGLHVDMETANCFIHISDYRQLKMGTTRLATNVLEQSLHSRFYRNGRHRVDLIEAKEFVIAQISIDDDSRFLSWRWKWQYVMSIQANLSYKERLWTPKTRVSSRGYALTEHCIRSLCLFPTRRDS